MLPQKLKNNPPSKRPQDARSEKLLQTYPDPRLTCFSRVWNFFNIFHKHVVSELVKSGSAIFHCRIRMKVELIRGNGWNTYSTGSKGYVWLLVRKSHGIASVTEMLSVKAVWVTPSVTGCHTLSTPIRKPKSNISYGRTSRECHWSKPRWKKRSTPQKVCSKFFMTSHNLSTPWQKSRKLGLQKKK